MAGQRSRKGRTKRGRRTLADGSSAERKKFVTLDWWLYESEAWLSLKPVERALYVHLKTLFNGRNNGYLWLSCRDAGRHRLALRRVADGRAGRGDLGR